MAQSSTIEWTQTTWNPLLGCAKVSAGCKNCYAERMSLRLAGMARAADLQGRSAGRKRYYKDVVNGRGRWSGRLAFVEEALEDPLRWRSPRLIFVNSMSDLFHEDVPPNFVAQVFDVMRRCQQHVFQVLTKRPERALSLASGLPWPTNVWLGTSVENSEVLGRIGALARIPATIRFLSLEPLIGPLTGLELEGIHWVIVGGESGPRSRPIDPKWVRAIRDLCLKEGVPFFFKQWGGTKKAENGRILDGKTWDQMPSMAPQPQRPRRRTA